MYQSGIKNAASLTQTGLHQCGGKVAKTIPLIGFVANKTNRPPHVLGSAAVVILIAILTLAPYGLAPILAELIIYYPLLISSLRPLLDAGPIQGKASDLSWKIILELWIIYMGGVCFETTIGRDRLAEIFPLIWVAKVGLMAWAYFAMTKTMPVIKAKPNPLYLDYSNTATKAHQPESRVPQAPRLVEDDLSPREDAAPSTESTDPQTSASTASASSSASNESEVVSSTYTGDSVSPQDTHIERAHIDNMGEVTLLHDRAVSGTLPVVGNKAATQMLEAPPFASPASSNQVEHSTISIADPEDSVMTAASPTTATNGGLMIDFDEVSSPDSDDAFDLDQSPVTNQQQEISESASDSSNVGGEEKGEVKSMSLDQLLLLADEEEAEINMTGDEEAHVDAKLPQPATAESIRVK